MFSLVPGLPLLLVTVAAGWWTWRRTTSEPRRLSNAWWIGATFVLFTLATSALGDGTILVLYGLVMLASPPLVLGLVALLVWNGVVMLRRERRSLGNSLSLLVAFVLVAALVVSAWTTTLALEWFPIGLWIALAGGWVALTFFGYLGYSWLYQRIARRRAPDYIVTLGSGLIGRRVPPLLAGRIDRALTVAREWEARGARPLLVMSGGQGRDEEVSEASAMGEYALSRGVTAEVLLLEERSRTTAENLRFTDELVRSEPRLGPDARGIAVTSNYHAMRAAMLARTLDVPVQVVGARTAPYYWPSAVLREYVAIMRASAAWQIVAFVVWTVPLPVAMAVATALD